MSLCPKCKNQTMLMSGTIFLEPDSEPYETGVKEHSRTNATEVEKHIIANYCERCDEIVDTYNE